LVTQSAEQIAKIEQLKQELKQKDDILQQAKEAIVSLHDEQIILPIASMKINNDEKPKPRHTTEASTQTQEAQILPLQHDVDVKHIEELERKKLELNAKVEKLSKRYKEVMKKNDEKTAQFKIAMQDLENTRRSSIEEQTKHNQTLEQLNDANQTISHLRHLLTEETESHKKDVERLSQNISKPINASSQEISNFSPLKDITKHVQEARELLNPSNGILLSVEKLAKSNQVLTHELEHSRKKLEYMIEKYKKLKAEVRDGTITNILEFNKQSTCKQIQTRFRRQRLEHGP
jgi:DNA repair exonuclease SbcCD ATPase subunit